MEEKQISIELHFPRLFCPYVNCPVLLPARAGPGGAQSPSLCILGPLIIGGEEMSCYSLMK